MRITRLRERRCHRDVKAKPRPRSGESVAPSLTIFRPPVGRKFEAQRFRNLAFGDRQKLSQRFSWEETYGVGIVAKDKV